MLCAGGALVLLAPLMVLLALAVFVSSGGPVFFRQKRVGLRGRTFTLYKFRTMHAGTAGPSVTASGDSRVTPIGKLLRRTKLDELPELWNVLRGDLALVGPRPEVPTFVDPGDPLWRKVLTIRPGLTHPVTTRLRNEEDLLAGADGEPMRFYREVLLPYKLKGYLDYERKRTPLRDLVVIAWTAAVVFVPNLARIPGAAEIERAVRQDQGAQGSSALADRARPRG